MTGTLDGRKGSVVINNTGDYDGGEATGTWTVVSGSGTGELAGITGHGVGRAPSGAPASYELEYQLA